MFVVRMYACSYIVEHVPTHMYACTYVVNMFIYVYNYSYVAICVYIYSFYPAVFDEKISNVYMCR